MTERARFRQSDVAKALKAAKSCGYGDVKVRIDVAGQIEIIVGKAANDSPPPPEFD